MNKQHETIDAFASRAEPEEWNRRNHKVAALFLNNELRIADAHDGVIKCIQTLQDLGFDTDSLSVGYGRALDFVMDGAIEAISYTAGQLAQLLN